MYDSTYVRYLKVLKGIESRMVVSRGWGRGENELLFNRYRFSLLQDEKSYWDEWW